MTEWLSVPEFAARLGIKDSQVREFVRERHIVAVRRGANSAVSLPADYVVDTDEGPAILPTLRGTITVLADAGLNDDAIVEWLLAHNDELDATPLDALRSGKRAPVRRIAQTLL